MVMHVLVRKGNRASVFPVYEVFVYSSLARYLLIDFVHAMTSIPDSYVCICMVRGVLQKTPKRLYCEHVLHAPPSSPG